MNLDLPNHLLTIDQVAAITQKSPATVRAWIYRGVKPPHLDEPTQLVASTAGRVRIAPNDLKAFWHRIDRRLHRRTKGDSRKDKAIGPGRHPPEGF